MNLLPALLKVLPPPLLTFVFGGGGLLNILITAIIVILVVALVVWLVSQFAGPPNIPEPFRWIIWVIVAIALLIFILHCFGIAI